MRGLGVILLVSLAIGAAASFITSDRPDTLEGFLESETGGHGEEPTPANDEHDEEDESPFEAILSGVLGTVITFVVLFGFSRLLRRPAAKSGDDASGEQCTT